MDFNRFLNFGNITLDRNFNQQITIWNTGSVEGSFEFPEKVTASREGKDDSGEFGMICVLVVLFLSSSVFLFKVYE